MDIKSRLGCIPHIPSEKDYPVQRLLAGKPQEPRSYTWRCTKVLDQGNEGSCVGHGWAHELISRPSEILTVDHEYAVQIYHDAQRLDEWEGGSYPNARVRYEGSSVKAGAKATMVTGKIGGYYIAQTFNDFLLGLSYHGPSVVGSDWLNGMNSTDSKGFIHATGSSQGGHCYLINKINVKDKYVGMVNSWGESWGVNGTAKISWTDAEKLFFSNGGVAMFAENRRS